MRPAKHLFILLTILVTSASCKKTAKPASSSSSDSTSTTTTTTNANGCQLTDRFDGTYDWEYTYNADKTLNNISIQQQNLYPWNAVFVYNGDTTVESINANGEKNFVDIVKNSQGQITDLHYVSTGLTTTPLDWVHFSFTYNGQNPSHCTMTVDGIDKIAFFNYTYTNGNLTEITADPQTTFDLDIHDMTFTYDESKPAVQCDLFWEFSKFGTTLFWYPDGIYNALYPVQNKNIVTAMTATDSIIVKRNVAYTFEIGRAHV